MATEHATDELSWSIPITPVTRPRRSSAATRWISAWDRVKNPPNPTPMTTLPAMATQSSEVPLKARKPIPERMSATPINKTSRPAAF